MKISQVSAGGLSYVDFTMPPDLTLHLDGTDDLSVTTLILTVPAAALAQAVGSLPEQPRSPLRFDSLRPASPAAAQRWRDAATHARSILADDQAAARPLITGSLARLLAATVLTVFPNDAVDGPARQDSRDAHPDTLRRAIAFMEANPHRDITVTDVAAACFVTPRAVQLAFQHHLDTTPTAYLRRLRLDRAHRDLAAADPAKDSVTDVALRWGFAHPSRFAGYYRTAYGVPPSHTLHESG